MTSSTQFTTTLSDEFLDWFPPLKVHHQVPCCIVSQSGILWSPEQKQVIVKELTEHCVSLTILARYLSVNCSRLCKLLDVHKRGGVHHVNPYSPCRIDATSERALINATNTAERESRPLKISEMKEKICQEAILTDIRRGNNGMNSTISPKTIRATFDRINESCEKGTVHYICQISRKTRYS